MGYREHAPPAALQPWLACTWEQRADAAISQRVLPDGCIDLLWMHGGGTYVVGPNTAAFVVGLKPGDRLAGARLRPGAAPALLGVAAESVRDATVPVEQLWGDAGARLADTLADHADPLGGLQATLLSRAARSAPPDELVQHAVARLSQPDATVAATAATVGVSERQLRRRVAAAVGYGPKLLARVLRLRGALSAAWQGDELARAAYDAGYADQAHFAHECRALGGVSPSALVEPASVSYKTRPDAGATMQP